MKKYAFFDVDNTIYNGYTATDILMHLFKKKIINKEIITIYKKTYSDYLSGKISYNEISQICLDLVSQSLKGLSVNQGLSLVAEMLSQKKSILNNWVEEVFNYLKHYNYKIVLISAGPDLVIRQIAKIFKITDWFATIIDHKDNIYLGNKTILLNDTKKNEVIDKLLLNNEIFSIGFGDSTGDIPMLQRVNEAFVYANKDHDKMMQYAKENKWTVFSNAMEVISILKHYL